MRLMTLKYARPGMVVELPVYDNFGSLLLSEHNQLDAHLIAEMKAKGVPVIFIRDYRVMDVLVAPLFSPQSEGVLASAFRSLVQQVVDESAINKDKITKINEAIFRIIRDMSLNVIGDFNVSCHILSQDYVYLQPVKTAGLSLAIGNTLQLPKDELATLGMAALLKDICLPVEIIKSIDSIAEGDSPRMRSHPVAGYKFLMENQIVSKQVAETILQHHEHWSGSGYPQGLKGKEISQYARIISIADAFVDLLAERPGRTRYMPHEAIEYVMAGSGDQFDPEIVELFVRQVPSYPSGLLVQLNTGEKGVVSNPKRGFVARPVVRVYFTAEQGSLENGYDMDLSQVKYQRKLITKVLEYD